MTVVVSLLRAVNLGPHNRMKMDALLKACESLGFLNAKTYVQSGNVVFRTKEHDLTKLSRRFETAIERTFGFRSAVICRTREELEDVVQRNPFAKRPEVSGGKLIVAFLGQEPTPDAAKNMSLIKTNPEEVVLSGRELYIHFPNGQGRSKLSIQGLERTLGTASTARNWNSVTKLLAMAQELESTD